MHRPISTRQSMNPVKIASIAFLGSLALFCIFLLVTAISPTASDKLLSHQQNQQQQQTSNNYDQHRKETLEKEKFGLGKHYHQQRQEHEVGQGHNDKDSCCKGHMVMVAGHGVFRGSDFSATSKIYDESSWAIEEFQKGQHLPESVLNHISMGLKIIANDPSATLVFSGTQSRKDCGSRSEGGTYLELVLQNFLASSSRNGIKSNNKNNNVFQNPDNNNNNNNNNGDNDEHSPPSYFNEQELAVLHEIVSNQTSLPSDSSDRRLLAEEFARDSYENLLFSISRYYQYHGSFPRKITVIGFPHKSERFSDWHRTAILWPRSWFRYVGVQSKKLEREIRDKTRDSPSDEGSLRAAKSDPYLCNGHRKTREDRNPNRVTAPYALVVPGSVRELLEWCGPNVFFGALPWTTRMQEMMQV